MAATHERTSTRHTLHTLRVAEVEQLTDDAVAITFELPETLRETFAFAAGQHLALVRDGDGEDGGVRRSYSVCAPVGGPLRVAVKRIPHGAFSTWAHAGLRAGDTLRVLPPAGRFGPGPLDPARTRHCAAVVAGSGITPVLSIAASLLEQEPESRFTLLYGNRTVASIMFLEELEELKNRFPTRLELFHVLSREPRDAELLEGRLDAAKLERFLDLLLPVEQVDEWFLCGPLGLVEDARRTLAARGVEPAAIHRELFHAEGVAPVARALLAGEQASGAAVTIVLDGRTTELTVPRDGRSILEATLLVRPDAPYACKGGVCGTCRCRLLEGEVEIGQRYALEDDELAAGVRLACQAQPLSDRVVLDFDAV
ncbi:MAG TPA: 1,2-phenylacetyl-CoA epoxidase subunit PaaE [Conexibacter sp.]|nr:1,2-phenylacetyl-CoA epoxidase subunit PaaE [Conexibacter sp.]